MAYNLTQTAFAKVAGISQARVSQLVAEGLPVDDAGRIDPEAGKAWIAVHIDPDRRRGGGDPRVSKKPMDPDRWQGGSDKRDSKKPASATRVDTGPALRGGKRFSKNPLPEEPKPEDGGTLQTVSRLRMHKLARESQLLDIELKHRNGEVVDRAEVERAVFAKARAERDVWLSFASRASAALAMEGIDPGRSFPVLDKLVRAVLGELAATPLKLDG